MKEIYTVIGLMSGTSMDGVDAAIIKTDGKNIIENANQFAHISYDNEIKKSIKNVILYKNIKEIVEVENRITKIHADAVEKLLHIANLSSENIDIIGFHGHTIDHRPDEGVTHQIGDGKMLAVMTGINVVNDFRGADVRAGGQGAPLVPLYHNAVLSGENKPVAILNIGGVANITYIGNCEQDIIAFDTGAGNALIDDWVFKHTGEPYDKNGKIAAKGVVDKSILDELLSHEYFDKKPPKSLDRNDFSSDLMKHLSLENGATTLTCFTVKAIKMATEFLPSQPCKLYVTGGGRYNNMIMKLLSHEFSYPVYPIDKLGLNGDMIEAEAFAYLAVRSVKHLPITLANITGAKVPSVHCGVFYPT